MFWRVAGLSTTSPVESVLDKDGYTLEELLDEDEIIQECKALNSRLINFLRGKAQVQALLRYVVEEPPENADNKRAFKFPFIACEIFTCEIDVIFKTLVEDEELMNYLFSFLEPDRPHGTLLAGYFSKVAIRLLLRKTVPVMRYLQTHQEVLKKLVDLIGITSIMQVLSRLVDDEHIYAYHVDSLQWLADTDLLEMLVDKLSPPHSSDVHANAAETLSAVTRVAPSALASKLSSPKFVGRLFHHVLEDPESKSTLVNSLSVCISLLDPKRAASVAAAGAARGQQVSEPVTTANPETVEGMLHRLGDLLAVLDVSTDKTVLPTTYGRLQPPLGIHRLKIVEFIAVLLRANSEGARHELVKSGAIQVVLKLFFDYPFNNMLHHHVESVITSCLESNDQELIDHLFDDCQFLDKLLDADENPYAPDIHAESKPAVSKSPTRIGNMGHLTRLANRINQGSTSNPTIQGFLQANPRWSEWVTKVLQPRNTIENVFQWSCGRPTAVQDRPVESDEDDFRDRDYDISTMANNINREVYRYGMFDNDDADEGHGAMERDEEDMFFDDESAEVVISSLRLGDEHDRSDSMFGPNSNWFAFQDDFTRSTEDSTPTFLISSPPSRHEDGLAANIVSPPNSSGDSSSDDEVVLGEDEDLVDTATSANSKVEHSSINGLQLEGKGSPTFDSLDETELSSKLEKVDLSDNLSLFQQRQEEPGADHAEPAGEAPVSSEAEAESKTQHVEPVVTAADFVHELVPAEGHMINPITGEEVAGVDPDGTIKAMEKMLKEGVVGEAEPMFKDELHGSDHRKGEPESPPKDSVSGNSDFNDVNYWRSEYSQSVVED
jgi:serine/threonine-protein phosphatase 6 regulatory subunit 3